MKKESKKVVYPVGQERLLNGNALYLNEDANPLLIDALSRLKICEMEILRLQGAIYSIEEAENLEKLKKRYLALKKLDTSE